MTNQGNDMAALAGWLEDKFGEIQAQTTLDEIEKMDRLTSENPERIPDYLEVKLLSDLICSYRKELLRQIKEFKTLRIQESVKELVALHVCQRLKNMEEAIIRGIQDWQDLRDDYFIQRACCMEHYRRNKEGFRLKEDTIKEEVRCLKRGKQRA